MKKIVLLLILLVSVASFSQSPSLIQQTNEIERQRGRFFVNGKQISTREVKQLLQSNAQAYSLFKKSKRKESIGGLLLGLGGVIVTVDLAIGLFSDVEYPSFATYVGAGAILTSIPILSGKNKRMDEGLDIYNKGLKNVGQETDVELNVIANQYGYGLQFRF
ncbi:MAG: hypothetical protein V4648_06570 [Bacteroidota bacterium]